MIEDQEDHRVLRHTVHELRNILCIIIGNLDLLRDCTEADKTKRINGALRGASRVHSVIAALDNLSNSKPHPSFQTDRIVTVKSASGLLHQLEVSG